MTKLEKYFKDDITPNEAYDLLFEFVGYISLLNVDSQDERIKTYDKVMNFLNQEVKPTLTEDEKVILRNIDDTKHEGLMIKRCKNENLIVYNGGNWAWQIDIFNHLFQFIKPRRRI